MARDNFIGGAWRPAHSRATDEVIEPATGARLDEVASSDRADVDDAVAAAAGAFNPRPATTPRQRLELLSYGAEAGQADMAELQELESLDLGKTRPVRHFPIACN